VPKADILRCGKRCRYSIASSAAAHGLRPFHFRQSMAAALSVEELNERLFCDD
jgi:hypothetical protein